VSDPVDVLRSWAVQDSPPGAATAALVARVPDLPVGWLDAAIASREVIALYNARTATAVVPASEAAAFATAFLPVDAEPEVEAVPAVADALDGRSLSRDDLHEELRARLPSALLPWCEGCQSHHARRRVLVLAGLHGKLCLAGRVGRQPLFARTDQLISWDPPADAGAELVRRYHAQYGASSRKAFAAWSGLTGLWAEGDGEPERLPGLALLAPGDPILLTRDREALVPDPAMRKKLWSAIPTTGLITDDGEAVGLWKARKRGKRLEITVEGDVDLDAVRARAEVLAPHRGATSVVLA
jgi:hypothetical protein